MKHLQPLAILILASTVGWAQPVFTNANLPTAGDAIVYDLADSVGVIAGPGGAGATWDFSRVNLSGDTLRLTYFEPSATPYAEDYPDASLAEHSDATWGYYRLEGGRWTRLGESSDVFVGSQWMDPLDIARLPWRYGERISDSMAHVFESQGVQTRRIGSIEAEYDGYGTLVLPHGTYTNVIRIRYTQTIIDTADIPAGSSSVGMRFTSKIAAWIWYREGEHQPLLAMDTSTVHVVMGPPINRDQTTRSVHVQVSRSTMVTSLLERGTPLPSISPNPVRDRAVIRGLDTARFQQVLVTDLHGTVVRARQLHSSETHLDLSTLPAGLYLITLHGKWGSERMPVIKVR